MSQKCGGFTLLESLFALIILAFVLMLIIQIPYSRWQAEIESRIFFDQLTLQLNLSQQKAITFGKTQFIRFSAQSQTVNFTDEILVLPSDWHLSNTFNFYYLPNGRVEQFQTVYFHHQSGKSVAIVFQLGSGKFEIKAP